MCARRPDDASSSRLCKYGEDVVRGDVNVVQGGKIVGDRSTETRCSKDVGHYKDVASYSKDVSSRWSQSPVAGMRTRSEMLVHILRVAFFRVVPVSSPSPPFHPQVPAGSSRVKNNTPIRCGTD